MESNREKMLINHGWRFWGNPRPVNEPKTKVAMYLSAKTERLRWGPGSYQHGDIAEHWHGGELCDEPWQAVDLPHDYIIEQAPDPSEAGPLGYFKYFPAWYRKHFSVPESDEGRRISIYFEGITGLSDIYLNGCFLKHHEGGYTSFEVDITDLVRFGEKVDNVIAVYVNPTSYETWWYAGGGIYRNVWLVKTDLVAVDLWGVFVPAKKIAGNEWDVPLEVTVRNDGDSAADVKVTGRILSPSGEEVGLVDAFGGQVAHYDKSTFAGGTKLSSPALWDLDAPNQYTMEVTVKKRVGDAYEVCDVVNQRFGFREIEWSGETGFWLNGRNVKLKGVCGHLDFGLTGKAVPDNICRYKMQMIKEMGANAFRTSHYPHQEATMDACDEMGIMVMDETRRFESNEEGLSQMEMLVKRDRNRPSVILWSTGNEEQYHQLEQGKRIHKKLENVALRLDPTRLVTSAMVEPLKSKVAEITSVIGFNYGMRDLEAAHEKYPDRPFVSSENCAVASTRGWYYGDSTAARGLMDARDRNSPHDPWYFGRELTWKYVMEHPWNAGTFQWDAFEHRGEAIWPRLCSVSGAIDLFLQRKDAFYQNQSHWLDIPMVHILPHWNHSGMDGFPFQVWAYTNCDEVELFLNGESLGRKVVEHWLHVSWDVSYTPGRLEAIAYKGGVEVARCVRETTGEPVGLALRLENGPVKANGLDIALFTCVALDGEGREVPDATPMVYFDCVGGGKIVGTGSSNIDHTPVPCLDRKMYAGKISVAVKVGFPPKGSDTAKVTLIAKSDMLKGTFLTIEAKR
ncbi:MAG: glycoside hydrolase family 2 protein [Lentisphaerae bacterium]|jgi:beta-galactosidase|nr:glycoside hydrolase family 2 protein [Lentisphaerota bacterium]